MIHVTRKSLAPGDRYVPWTSQLPAHWPLVALKYMVQINELSLSETTPPDTEIRYIDISNVDGLGNIGDVVDYTFESAPSRARRVPRTGDTIVSTVRTYLKAIAYLDSVPAGTICSTGFAVLTPSADLEPKFLYYWMRSSLVIDEIVARSEGVSYPAIGPSDLGGILIPRIPKDLQQTIVRYLDKQLASVDRLLDLVRLPAVAEYREALITAAVAGRIQDAEEEAA